MTGCRIFHGCMVTLTIVLLTGCVTRPTMNKRLERFDVREGYRYANLELGDGNSDELIVALTFSGGGTRAAAFAYGVLEQLREMTIGSGSKTRSLLDEVDFISSVSGGSLTAAAYALHGEQFFDTFPERVLYSDIQGDLVKQVFKLANLPKLASPYYGRSDLLADGFERYLKNATFGDLLERNQRPYIMINTTDVALGVQFAFTQFYFDFLYSDLSSYPLSRAIAASAAVPGLLTAMTLTNYPKETDYSQPAWIQQELQRETLGSKRYRRAVDFDSYSSAERKYVHLVDGGVTDNLGLLPLLHVVADAPTAMSAEQALLERGAKTFLIITVNAKTRTQNDWSLKEDIVGIFKMLRVVTGAPMGDFSEAQIAYMRLLLEKKAGERRQQALLEKLSKEYDFELDAPENLLSPIDYHFVELSFEQEPDPLERDYLLSLPTSFRLSQEQVDRIRASAKVMMERNADLQAVVRDLE